MTRTLGVVIAGLVAGVCVPFAISACLIPPAEISTCHNPRWVQRLENVRCFIGPLDVPILNSAFEPIVDGKLCASVAQHAILDAVVNDGQAPSPAFDDLNQGLFDDALEKCLDFAYDDQLTNCDAGTDQCQAAVEAAIAADQLPARIGVCTTYVDEDFFYCPMFEGTESGGTATVGGTSTTGTATTTTTETGADVTGADVSTGAGAFGVEQVEDPFGDLDELVRCFGKKQNLCFIDPALTDNVLSNFMVLGADEVFLEQVEQGGEVVGLRIVGLDPGESSTALFGALGFEDGDVLMRINGGLLRTLDERAAVTDQLIDADAALVHIERDGEHLVRHVLEHELP